MSFFKAIDDGQTIVFTGKSTLYVNIAGYVGRIHMGEKSNGTTTKETLKWVHIAIGNAKRNFVVTYHRIKKSTYDYIPMSSYTSSIEGIFENESLIGRQ